MRKIKDPLILVKSDEIATYINLIKINTPTCRRLKFPPLTIECFYKLLEAMRLNNRVYQLMISIEFNYPLSSLIEIEFSKLQQVLNKILEKNLKNIHVRSLGEICATLIAKIDPSQSQREDVPMECREKIKKAFAEEHLPDLSEFTEIGGHRFL